MTFVGFDLHKRYITACALTDAGEIIAEIRQLATALETVLQWQSRLTSRRPLQCQIVQASVNLISSPIVAFLTIQKMSFFWLTL